MLKGLPAWMVGALAVRWRNCRAAAVAEEGRRDMAEREVEEGRESERNRNEGKLISNKESWKAEVRRQTPAQDVQANSCKLQVPPLSGPLLTQWTGR
jgi:hypothetical protein